MKEIITDLTQINASEPFEFLTDSGIDEEAKKEGLAIIADLKETLQNLPNVIALAAPQIGINKRIFCIKFNDMIKTFINPIVRKKANYVIAPETCASMPGQEILISRPEELTVIYYTDEFQYEDNKLLGAAARLFDQQYQLLDGITPDVLGLVSTVETDGSLADLTEDQIEEAKAIYKKVVEARLKGMQKEIEASIESDKDFEKDYRMLNFMEGVINGRNVISETEGEAAAYKEAKRMANKSVMLSNKAMLDAKKAEQRAQLNKILRRK